MLSRSAADQLTGADRSGTANEETYSYDAHGNRSDYSTGSDNRLLSDGTYNYTYDNEGNRTRRTRIASGEVTLRTNGNVEKGMGVFSWSTPPP